MIIMTLPKLSQLLLFILFHLISPSFGKNWITKISGSSNNDIKAKSICHDPNGNIIVSGTFTTSAQFYDTASPLSPVQILSTSAYDAIYLAKYSYSGTLIWALKVDGNGQDLSEGISCDKSGNIIMIGGSSMTPVVVTDSKGTAMGEIKNDSGQSQAYIAKFSSTGQLLWFVKAGDGTVDSLTGIDSDKDGNIGVVGHSSIAPMSVYGSDGELVAYLQPTETKGFAFALKYGPSGELLWHTFVDGPEEETLVAIQFDTSGNMAVTGYYLSLSILIFESDRLDHVGSLTGDGKYNTMILRFSPLGKLQWSTRISGVAPNRDFDLAYDSNGNLAVSGGYIGGSLDIFESNGRTLVGSLPSSSQSNGFIVIYSISGFFEQAVRFNSILTDPSTRFPIKFDAYNNLILGSSYKSSNLYAFDKTGAQIEAIPNTNPPNSAGFLFKLSDIGEYIWSSRIDGSGNDEMISLSVFKSTGILSVYGMASSSELIVYDSYYNTDMILNSTAGQSVAYIAIYETQPQITDVEDRKVIACPNNAECTKHSFMCIAGYEKNAAGTGCARCANGYVKFSTSNSSCIACPIGSQPAQNQDSCVTCATGKYRSDIGKLFCETCPSNSICQSSNFSCIAGYTLSLFQTECTKCPDRHFKQEIGNEPCAKCPNGGYSTPDFINCIECQPGYYKDASTGQCSRCQIGFQPDTLRLNCIECPAGTFRSSLSVGDCQACPLKATCTSSSFKCQDGYKQKLDGTGCETDSTAVAAELPITNVVLIGGILGGFVVLVVTYMCYSNRRESDAKKKKRKKKKRMNRDEISRFDDLRIEDITSGSIPSEEKPVSSNQSYSKHHAASHDPSSTDMQTLVATQMSSGGQELSIPAFLQFQMGPDFRTEKFLCEGGGGRIFLSRAFNPELTKYGNTIITKECLVSGNTRAEQTFFQEVSIMYLLRGHENIAQLAGYTTEPLALLLKYYPLGSLASYLSSKKHVKTKKMLAKFMYEISDAMMYIHEHGIAHCDLKPANVLMDSTENSEPFCVLTDFGIARVIKNDILKVSEFQTVNINAASISYASPETLKVLKGKMQVTEIDMCKTDIYSMGILFQEILTRRGAWPTKKRSEDNQKNNNNNNQGGNNSNSNNNSQGGHKSNGNNNNQGSNNSSGNNNNQGSNNSYNINYNNQVINNSNQGGSSQNSTRGQNQNNNTTNNNKISSINSYAGGNINGNGSYSNQSYITPPSIPGYSFNNPSAINFTPSSSPPQISFNQQPSNMKLGSIINSSRNSSNLSQSPPPNRNLSRSGTRS